MRTKAIAFLAAALFAAGCGNGTPNSPAEPLGSSSYDTQVATPVPMLDTGTYGSTSPVVTDPATDAYTVTYPATDSTTVTSATDSATVTEPATDSSGTSPTASPAPVVEPTAEPLPLGTLPPDLSPSPVPSYAPLPAPSSPIATPAPQPLPEGVSYQVVNQWTTGWSLFGTQTAHVDLLVNYFPTSFLAPPVNVQVEVDWTKGGAIVSSSSYGPWQLTAPNSLEATFDAPTGVETDGEQIQVLPAQ